MSVQKAARKMLVKLTPDRSHLLGFKKKRSFEPFEVHSCEVRCRIEVISTSTKQKSFYFCGETVRERERQESVIAFLGKLWCGATEGQFHQHSIWTDLIGIKLYVWKTLISFDLCHCNYHEALSKLIF
jgi:hypothetical protein